MDFHDIKKTCENCGKVLELKNRRDIARKRFCSRVCCYQIIQPRQFVPPHSEETKEKMRKSKHTLLATGWKPIGWKKYLPIRRVSGRGYAFLGSKREHTVLMEQKLGRDLSPNEVVHHKDEDKSNNCLDNLEVMTHSEHMKLHTQRRLAYVTAGF